MPDAPLHPHHHITNEQLAAAAQRGDVTAYGVLVRRLMPRAFAVAWRILQHREDAEDLVQDVCVVAHERLGQYDASRPFAPWFMRIVCNRALNAREARSVRTTYDVPDDIAAADDDPARTLERDETRQLVRRALAALPERTRLVVELFELEEYSAQEIADMLGISAATVRWHAHAGRGALREALGHLAALPPDVHR